MIGTSRLLTSCNIDNPETFAPVAKRTSIRMLLSIAAKQNLELLQMEVATAFLNGNLEGKVCKKQPQGYENRDLGQKVCRLLHSFYGLKEAPCQWSAFLDAFLCSKLDMVVNTTDACIYARTKDGNLNIIEVYVDGLLIMSSCVNVMKK